MLKPRTPKARDNDRERRRMICRGFAGGAALPLLPWQWTAPVVESVVLPAHAQTSQCSDTVVIPRRSASCSGDPFVEPILYSFFFESGCLTYTQRTLIEQEPIGTNEMVVALYAFGSGDPPLDQVVVEVRLTGSTFSAETQNCGDPSPAEERNYLFVMPIGGTDFFVEYTVEIADGSIAISDITVSPES